MANGAIRAVLEGKNKILLFRRLADQETDAAKLAFQTTHTFSYSRELESVITKDGSIVSPGDLESEVSIEALQSKDDPLATMLKEAVITGEKLELWEVTVDEDVQNEEGKYPAVYVQGYIGEWEEEAGAEDNATMSGTFTVEMEPQFGYATLTEDQQDAVQYAFRDTIAEPTGA